MLTVQKKNKRELYQYYQDADDMYTNFAEPVDIFNAETAAKCVDLYKKIDKKSHEFMTNAKGALAAASQS